MVPGPQQAEKKKLFETINIKGNMKRQFSLIALPDFLFWLMNNNFDWIYMKYT